MSFLEKLLYMGLGFYLGLYFTRLEHMALRLVKGVGMNHDSLGGKVRSFAVWTAVLITFVTAYFAAVASSRSDSAAQQSNLVAKCNYESLGELLDAQGARAVALVEVQNATDALDAQFSDLLTVLADKSASKEMKLQAFNDYRDALSAKVELSQKYKQVREQNPLPTRDELVNCREGN